MPSTRAKDFFGRAQFPFAGTQENFFAKSHRQCQLPIIRAKELFCREQFPCAGTPKNLFATYHWQSQLPRKGKGALLQGRCSSILQGRKKSFGKGALVKSIAQEAGRVKEPFCKAMQFPFAGTQEKLLERSAGKVHWPGRVGGLLQGPVAFCRETKICLQSSAGKVNCPGRVKEPFCKAQFLFARTQDPFCKVTLTHQPSRYLQATLPGTKWGGVPLRQLRPRAAMKPTIVSPV